MSKPGSKNDGSFELYYKDGWAVLTVYPPEPGGKPVYHEDVRNRMNILNVPRPDPEKLRSVVAEAQGRPVRVVRWPDGARLESQISVDLSDDEMAAQIFVTHPRKGAAPPEAGRLEQALSRKGVRYGIYEDVLEDLVRTKRFDEWVLVAEGHGPRDAESAEIKYHFNTNRGKPYLEMDFGRINLRELNFIENRQSGDLLAGISPPKRGEDGRTVTGKRIPARKETGEVSLKPGENTRLSDDGTEIIAAEDGNVKLVEGAVVIEPLVVVENVNYETGNIHFDGSIVVEKNIADGFIVEAAGDVQVGKGVGRAQIFAGGNVLLKTGINGGGEGRVTCKGDLFAKYIESSSIHCEGQLIVEEAIMHSDLAVGRNCLLSGRRAEVIGSRLIVGESLWCKKLGSFAEAPVEVSLGTQPQFLIEYRSTQARLSSVEEELSKIREQVSKLAHAAEEVQEQGGARAEKLRQALAQLSAREATLAEDRRELHRKVAEMRGRWEASHRSMLVAEEMIFKGAMVSFGDRDYHAPERGARKTILRFNGAEIVESGFNPAEPPESPVRSG
jgi:hypothetical protein